MKRAVSNRKFIIKGVDGSRKWRPRDKEEFFVSHLEHSLKRHPKDPWIVKMRNVC